MDVQCHECEKPETEARLRKCPICFKHYCEDHDYKRSGLTFCSAGCAEYFFHGDPDD